VKMPRFFAVFPELGIVMLRPTRLEECPRHSEIYCADQVSAELLLGSKLQNHNFPIWQLVSSQEVMALVAIPLVVQEDQVVQVVQDRAGLAGLEVQVVLVVLVMMAMMGRVVKAAMMSVLVLELVLELESELTLELVLELVSELASELTLASLQQNQD